VAANGSLWQFLGESPDISPRGTVASGPFRDPIAERPFPDGRALGDRDTKQRFLTVGKLRGHVFGDRSTDFLPRAARLPPVASGGV